MKKLVIHQVKVLPEYYDATNAGIKNFELRYNDRTYKTGDWLELREWDGSHYTGRKCIRKITHVFELDKIGFIDWVALTLV